MKISNFLMEKKIIFNNGVAKVENQEINGEVTFYNLTKERIETIYSEVIKKFTDEDTKETSLYKLFSYLTDVEVDVDLPTFLNMLDYPPNNQFALVEEEYIKIFEDLFNKVETQTRINDNTSKLVKKLPEVPKSKQEIKKELMGELGTLQENTKENKAKRKEIFIKLAELEG